MQNPFPVHPSLKAKAPLRGFINTSYQKLPFEGTHNLTNSTIYRFPQAWKLTDTLKYRRRMLAGTLIQGIRAVLPNRNTLAYPFPAPPHSQEHFFDVINN